MRYKKLSRSAMMRNINGLSEGDKAYCGPYGTVTCYSSAANDPKGVRRFKVTGSKHLTNAGNWTMKSLRKAIESRKSI